jgi:pseudouridine-5'-phosphate glycosidase
MSDSIRISDEVSAALARREAVVALETTLVTHGFPHPEGLEAAAELDAVVRKQGAVPATIGVLDGAVRVGMTPAELERLATSPAREKLNPGNLAAQVVSRQPGSTTVAATMMIAARAGIRVFATGGIGGVHYGANETGDVSADLLALARYRVAVVSAGAKAVLDLPRTLEFLETHGVPVIGFRTGRFAAFYRRDSGLPVDARCDSADELAAVVRTHASLSPGGLLVVNPVPAEFELPRDLYERALQQARIDIEKAGIRGRAVTPFLLERMRQLTEGASVFSNRALLANNARLAAELAVALAAKPVDA